MTNLTQALFRNDAYLRETTGTVLQHVEGGVIIDQTNFYPRGGGQPGDCGCLTWQDGKEDVTDTVKAAEGGIALMLAGQDLPPVGSEVRQTLDWDRRYRLMRIHTALHLLSVVIPLPVTGGAISAEKGRLDFDMPEAPEDKEALTDALNAMIARNLPVTETWITDAELAANPGLVKTMSVKPPTGAGKVRLVRIGQGADQVDLQPCGGTHVATTREIGAMRIGKIEKKGRQNRRVNLFPVD